MSKTLFDDLGLSDEEVTPMLSTYGSIESVDATKNYKAVPIEDSRPIGFSIEANDGKKRFLDTDDNIDKYVTCECENGYCGGSEMCCAVIDKCICGCSACSACGCCGAANKCCSRAITKLCSGICGVKMKINNRINITLIIGIVFFLVFAALSAPILYILTHVKYIAASKILQNRIRINRGIYTQLHFDSSATIDAWIEYNQVFRAPKIAWNRLTKQDAEIQTRLCDMETIYNAPMLVDYYMWIGGVRMRGLKMVNVGLGISGNLLTETSAAAEVLNNEQFTFTHIVPPKFLSDCKLYNTAGAYLIEKTKLITLDEFIYRSLCRCGYYSGDNNCNKYSIMTILDDFETYDVISADRLHNNNDNNNHNDTYEKKNINLSNLFNLPTVTLSVAKTIAQILLYENIIIDINMISSVRNSTNQFLAANDIFVGNFFNK